MCLANSIKFGTRGYDDMVEADRVEIYRSR